MSAPQVCIVMPTYRESRTLLEESFGSIASQSYENWELSIVVDNPEHPSFGYLREIEASDDRVRLIVNEVNLGVAQSLNKAVSQTRCALICRMDADDRAHEDRLGKQVGYLLDNRLDLVGSEMDVVDESGTFLYRVSQMPHTPDGIAHGLRFNNCVPHPTWLGRREVFELGYRQIPLCEDYDLLIRAVLAGYRLANVPESLQDYRTTADSVSRNNLFEQFLYQCHLADCYARSKAADESDFDAVKLGYSDARANRYSEAHALFNEGYSLASSGEAVRGAALMARSAMKSGAYAKKALRMFRASRLR